MATGMVGTASMLRARRRDVNVKPNRRLDRKSSRGMLYENEELRLRTININAEVERGQNDIKKLRRENEQLRREIWGLRDEYDRLEGLLGRLHASGCNSVGNAEELKNEENWKIEDDENGRTVEENEQNLQKVSSSIKMQGHKNSVKVNFDDLSVVDEENDDFIFGSRDSRERDEHFSHEEGHLVNIFPAVEVLTNYFPPGLDSPEYLCPASSKKISSIPSSKDRDIPNNKEEHFPRQTYADFPLPRGKEKAIRFGIEGEKPESRVADYDPECKCVHTNDICSAISTPQKDFSFRTSCQRNFPLSKEQTLSEAFQGHESLEILTPDIQEGCASNFPVGGNLDQLLNDVHGRKGEDSASRFTHSLKSDELGKRDNTTSSLPESTAISPEIAGPPSHRECSETDHSNTKESMNEQPAGSQSAPIKTDNIDCEELRKDGHGAQEEGDGGSVTAQLAELAVHSNTKGQQSSSRFQSNLVIQLKPAKDRGPTSMACPAPTRKVANVQNFIFQEHNPIFPEYHPSDTGWRRWLDRQQLTSRYESFISSTPELSEGKFDLFSSSMKELHSFQPSNDLSERPTSERKQCSPSSDVPVKCESDHVGTGQPVSAQGDLAAESSSQSVSKFGNGKNVPRNHTTSPNVDCSANHTQATISENEDSALSTKGAKPNTSVNTEQGCLSGRDLCVSRNKMCDSQETKPKFFQDDDLFTVNLPPAAEGVSWQNSSKTGPVISSSGVSKTQNTQSCNENECHSICKGTKSKQLSNGLRSRYSDYRSPHKLSVIVGDTQQGHSMPSPGLDPSTKVDRNRRVSVYSNSKRKFGFGGRKETRTRKQNLLTRSASLDPDRCCFVPSDIDGAIAIHDFGGHDRPPSVSSRTSSLGTGMNSMHMPHAPSRSSNHGLSEKSVPWCGCWGNGCI